MMPVKVHSHFPFFVNNLLVLFKRLRWLIYTPAKLHGGVKIHRVPPYRGFPVTPALAFVSCLRFVIFFCVSVITEASKFFTMFLKERTWQPFPVSSEWKRSKKYAKDHANYRV